ncbi:MAG: response regulator [Clostridia bacterium]|nr:response regulator [Clostridia bacterium]
MRYNILSVDEFGTTRIELSNMLRNLDVSIINVKDEIEMINTLHEKKTIFNAVAWTINSIDMKDFEAIKRLKSKEAYKSIPVIIVSKFTDKKYIIKAIESGAVEYVAKPYDEETVLKKICKILGVPFEKTKSKKIDEDIVTYNFSEMFNREIKAASRGGYPLTVTMASIVPLAAGSADQENVDGIISLVNRVIKTKLRETDTSFHYGINNLILLLPFADKSGSEIIKKKLKAIFASHSMIRQRNNGYELVVASVTFPDDGKIKGKLLERLESNFSTAAKTINTNESVDK